MFKYRIVANILFVYHHKLAEISQLPDVAWPVIAEKAAFQRSKIQLIVNVILV
jgi:hypothetical protein